MLSAVIFDFDGVILDSETPEFEAYRRIFEACGRTLTPGEWCDQIGVWVEGQAQRWFELIRDRPGAPATFEAFQHERRRLFDELVADSPMRGVADLMAALEAQRIPIGIASTSPSRWVVPALERLGIRDRFGAIVTADAVLRRKPAPDVYLEALRQLAAVADRTVALEDSGPGIASARAAGLKTVAIPHWLTERHDLAAADLRVAHAGELTLERLERLVAT